MDNPKSFNIRIDFFSKILIFYLTRGYSVNELIYLPLIKLTASAIFLDSILLSFAGKHKIAQCY